MHCGSAVRWLLPALFVHTAPSPVHCRGHYERTAHAAIFMGLGPTILLPPIFSFVTAFSTNRGAGAAPIHRPPPYHSTTSHFPGHPPGPSPSFLVMFLQFPASSLLIPHVQPWWHQPHWGVPPCCQISRMGMKLALMARSTGFTRGLASCGVSS